MTEEFIEKQAALFKKLAPFIVSYSGNHIRWRYKHPDGSRPPPTTFSSFLLRDCDALRPVFSGEDERRIWIPEVVYK